MVQVDKLLLVSDAILLPLMISPSSSSCLFLFFLVFLFLFSVPASGSLLSSDVCRTQRFGGTGSGSRALCWGCLGPGRHICGHQEPVLAGREPVQVLETLLLTELGMTGKRVLHGWLLTK